MKNFTAVIAASYIVFASSSVCGQAISDIPNSAGLGETGLRAVERSTPVYDPEAAPLSGLSINFPTQQPPANAGALEFVLHGIEFDGTELLPADQISPLYIDLIGKKITLQQAFDVISAIQAVHRKSGHIFTRVIAPPQTIDNGIFKIHVVEAKIGNVVIEQPNGDVGAPLPLIERMAHKLEGVADPTIQKLERTLLLINDIPGITQATAVPRSGEGPGTVDIFINVVRDPFSGVFFADNRQAPSLGPGLAGVSWEASSYTPYADTTTISYFNSYGDGWDEDLKKRNTVQIEHQRNLGTEGTILGGRFLASQTAPGDQLHPLDLDGTQFNGEIFIEHPFVRTRPLSVWGHAGFDFDNNTLDAGDGALTIVEDKIRTVSLGGRLLQRDDYGYTQAEVELRQGLNAFGATDTSSGPRSRFDGKPDYTLIRGQIEREVFVPDTNKALSIYGLALGQYSVDPLYSAEEFSIGGGQIGRAYDPSEYTGDSGYGVAGELRYQAFLEPQGYQVGMQFYGFGDYSEIHNRGDSGQVSSEGIASYGGGVRVSLPTDLTLTGELAIPAQKLQRNQKNDPRFFFNLVKRF